MEPLIATIMGWGPNWAPKGWSLCNGQLLSIAQNSALFSIIGTTYGGDGTTTFALPDLRGRAAVGWGQGPGLSNYALGESTGTERHTLTTEQMPTHSHMALASSMQATFPASRAMGTSATPENGMVPATLGGTVPGSTFSGTVYADYSSADTVPLHPTPVTGDLYIGNTGGNLPFSIVQPVLAISMIIALVGIFPSRS
jgi:microcystin-dependent protein